MIEAGAMSPRFSPMALGLKIKSYSYPEIVQATNGFSEENFLGEGGFGKVHKGTLPKGNVIAVKCLSPGSSQGDKKFRAEIETISNIRHEHLVPLIGYCMARGQRILVYQFISNGTLQYHLHQNGQVILDWEKRLRAAIGIAKGLVHLHEECHPRVIHRDIKSANILLDDSYHAKARPIMEQALHDGRFNTIVDQKLGRQYDRLKMTNLIACAAACIRKPANMRPKLSKVVGVLEDRESMALLDDALTEHVTRQPSYHLS